MFCSTNDKSDVFAAVRPGGGQSGRLWPLAGVLSVLALASFAAGAAVGCDTPVYRYAMYNWNAAPYQVFFFHDSRLEGSDSNADGPHVDGQSQEANRLLREMSASDRPLNVNLIEVDVSDPHFEQLPFAVKEAWRRWRQKNDSKISSGSHAIFSPWGRELFAGRLDVDTVRAMAESPARKRLCELLQEGHIVAVCLTADKDANNRSVAEAVETLPKVLPLVELLEVSASDPKEAWFVKTLMAAEPDLEEYADETMVFMAYGRARAMLPYVGKGVTAENLARGIAFLSGACSCQVKADNPGIDLLTRWDWASAADVMAADDEEAPALDGQLVYHEFDPAELSGGQNGLPDNRFADTKLPNGQTPASRTADVADENIAPPAEGSFAMRQAWYLGGGLAVVVAVMIISGLFIMRR